MEVTIQSNGLKLFQVRGKNNFVFIWRFQHKVVSLHHQTETDKQIRKEVVDYRHTTGRFLTY